MSQASEVYARLLLPKRLGFPLWCPAPDANLPNEYRLKGVSIGDIGVLTDDGGFDFLFNICLPPEDPINSQYGVPDGFENVSEFRSPIQISKQDGYHPPDIPISSTSAKDKDTNAHISLQDIA